MGLIEVYESMASYIYINESWYNTVSHNVIITTISHYVLDIFCHSTARKSGNLMMNAHGAETFLLYLHMDVSLRLSLSLDSWDQVYQD